MGKCHFQDCWITDKRFKTWIKRHPKLTTIAICKICNNTEINIGKMGVSALLSHKGGKKHEGKENDSPLSALFFTKNMPAAMLPTSDPEITSLSSTPDQAIPSASSTPPASIRLSHQGAKSSSVQKSIKVPVAVLDAEIRWASKVVTSHLSFHSCLELNTLFNTMFSDSDIASKFRMSKTKCGYIVTFGMATFFKKILAS